MSASEGVRGALARVAGSPPADVDQVLTVYVNLLQSILARYKDLSAQSDPAKQLPGGLPIPGDKKAVPQAVFVALFRRALQPPAGLMTVPLTADRPEPVEAFASLLLRPMVCPSASRSWLRPVRTSNSTRWPAPWKPHSNPPADACSTLSRKD